MKKIVVFSLVILVFLTMAHAEKLGVLTHVNRPEMIEIYNDQVITVEGASIILYSLKGLKFIRKFGKAGEGPGEFKVNRSATNFVMPLADSIFGIGIDKAIQFDYSGKVIKEFRIPTFSQYLHPIGKGYVGMKLKPLENGKAKIAAILYDSSMKEIKDVYIQDFSGGQNLIDLTLDALNVSVHQDRIYVDQSKEGFVVGVYDSQGKLLYKISRPYKKLKYTKEHGDSVMNKLKNDPTVKGIGWDNLKNIIKTTHGEYLPSITDMMIADNHLYLKTSVRKNKKAEFVVTDLKGNFKKVVLLPNVESTLLVNIIFGRSAKLYKIYKNKFYYLHENEDEEEWEVHVVPIQ